MDTRRSRAPLAVAIVVIVIALAILYLFFFTNLLNFLHPGNSNVFNENGVYFQYAKNWTVISSNYNATSNTAFYAMLIPDSLVGVIAYPNGSLIPDSSATAFSEIGISILTNTSLGKMYGQFIFNESYSRNGTYISGYPGSEGVTYINASPLNPQSESVTYIAYGNGLGYSVGAFFTPTFNASTQDALGVILKTLKYKG